MKISLNWLKKFVDIDVSDEDLIRLIGARLVEVEGVIDETHKYDNIVIVKVEKAERIPDTHLTLCQVNDGNDDLTQVICGAPNVREGMLAAWIKPGAIVPASVHEDAPFVIGKRRMLNKYDSNGMLAGADELDFGGDHSGIAEIDPEMAKPGELLEDVFELNDKILEIENKSLTHRPDCFGMIGFAREVAGILGQKFDFNSLDLVRSLPSLRGSLTSLGQQPSRDTVSKIKNQISIQLANPDICPRYSAVVMAKHGEIKKKYLTIQDTLLAKSGMRPIDPIVDATNYLMLLTGQPLHAFDYDKFVAVGKSEEPAIIVRLAKAGEKLTLLDDTEVELNENDIVITSNDVPVALAGAMGGKSTMIDEDTKNIILESATFSLYNLRKTQMAHGIFSEAITRFTKGQPPYQTLAVANKCAELLKDGFEVASVSDNYQNKEKENVVKITTDEINGLLGTDYNKELIVKTLENVNFDVETEGNVLTITAPAWRTDIHIKEDIIEEVGRLLGYDNIAPTLPLHATANHNPLFDLKCEIRGYLAKFGANELLTYSFVSSKLLEKAGQDFDNSYRIVNSISPELQYVRQSIVPSLLDKAFLNEKLPVEQFAIFEMNKIYQKGWGLNDENVPVEKNQFGFVVAERKSTNTAFYLAKKYVNKILKHFGIDVEYVPLATKDALARPFEPKRAAEIRLISEPEVLIGVVGEFKKSVQNNFKLADYLAGFEIDLDALLKYRTHDHKVKIKKLEKRDLTVATKDSYQKVVERVKRVLSENGSAAEITPGLIYQPEGVDEKHITLHLAFEQFDENIMKKLEEL